MVGCFINVRSSSSSCEWELAALLSLNHIPTHCSSFHPSQVLAAIPSVYMVSLPDGKYANWVEAFEFPNLITAETFMPSACWSGGYLSLLLVRPSPNLSGGCLLLSPSLDGSPRTLSPQPLIAHPT